MNILVLTSLYASQEYPRKDDPWTVPFFAREWVKQGHKVIAIVNSTTFPVVYYYGVILIRPLLVRKYNITGDDLSNRQWTRTFSYNDQGVHVYNLPIKKYFPSGLYSNKRLDAQIKSIISILDNNNFRPDVITGHWINPQFFLISKLKQIYNCQTSFVFEGDFWPEYIKKYKLCQSKYNIDRIGCRSKYASESLKNSLVLDYNPYVCASGIPQDYILSGQSAKKVFKDNQLSVISAGRLVGLKHFDSVITACVNGLRGTNYSLCIAGDGTLYNFLSEQIEALGVANQVSLLGKIPREELMHRMATSDVFVLISDHEAFGLVYLEAMAQGCIVVASKNGGIDGIIENGVNGFLCTEGDASELAEVLKFINSLSANDKQRISQAAKDTVKCYSDPKAAMRYLDNIVTQL